MIKERSGFGFLIGCITAGMLTLTVIRVEATHIRAADILVERTCGTRTFKITVVAYLSTLSNTRFGGDDNRIYFGDGTFASIPETPTTPRPDLGENVGIATFTTFHTYTTSAVYNIYYIEGDRNAGVLNIRNSHDAKYVTFVKIDTDDQWGCNRYPVLSVVPLDRGCSRRIFFHTPGAYDSDGDSLSYEFTTPSIDEKTFADYVAPNDQRFYSNFNAGNEAASGVPTLDIDPLTGVITWDAPGTAGEYSIAFRIIEWRKNANGQYRQLSSTTRDMQILIEPCANTRPDLQVPADLCVVAGTPIHRVIAATDAETHPVKIEAFSEIFLLPEGKNPATYSPDPPAFAPSAPPAELTVDWNTACAHVRQQPYQVVFKVTDDAGNEPGLATFKTWNIRVIAPAPVIQSAVLDVTRNHGVLEWQNYPCENATAIQVWRKTGSYDGPSSNCNTGIPVNAGFQLIATIPASTTSFRDTNFGMALFPGGFYCYRLVAIVGDTKSKVSSEYCIGPVKRDAPVITHVTIEKTATSGHARVSWRSPDEMNKEQFPEPYEYEIYRAEGFIGERGISRIGYTRDTTFIDEMMNSKDSVYNFRIVVYSKPAFSDSFIPVDTSAVASTVRLYADARENAIELHWRDSVPWSDVDASRPYHLIYRAAGFMNETDLLLHDSVNVTESGFIYTDTQVASDQIYTYKILSRGTYGNAIIPLQENFSQAVSLYPANDLKACAPILAVENLNCDEFLSGNTCEQTAFANRVNWTPDAGPGCRVDIVAYKLYTTNGRDTTFTIMAETSTTSYQDTVLGSPIRCYRVSAVDALGNESAMSEPGCNDSCPFFTLPNVFTPNADGCNDLFSSRYNGTPESNADCGYTYLSYCPRFVKAVKIQIYNRWGKLVHSSDSNTSGSVYIDWDGRDNTGSPVAAGIYYYIAEVQFEALDPSGEYRIFKDWIHLIR